MKEFLYDFCRTEIISVTNRKAASGKEKAWGGHFQLKETKQTQQELHCIPNQRKKTATSDFSGTVGEMRPRREYCMPALHPCFLGVMVT